MTLVRPRRLNAGDAVAVLSMSWGGPYEFPGVFDAGLDSLRRLGLDVVEMPSTRRSPEDLLGDPQARADDLNAAFADPSIAAIIASIGGDDSARILPFLDLDVIREHPKILLGYSDTTIQTFVLNHELGLVTFNGPSAMAGFAQMQHFPDLEQHVRDVLFVPQEALGYHPYPEWIAQYEDWDTSNDPTAIAAPQPQEGWHWLNGTSARQGRLVGGCIEVLEFLKGTRYWPAEEWWQDRILFLETSEDVPTVDSVRYWLFNYGLQGVFDRLSGLIFGRPAGYTSEMVTELESMIRTVVVDMFGATDLPIVTNMDFGHTDPQWILPLGVLAELDPETQSFRLLEAAVM